MADPNFVTNLIGALADPKVVELLSTIYKNATKECLQETTTEISNRMEDLEINVINNETRIERVETKIDNIEQKEKNSNIIVRGVPAGIDVLQKSLELLNKEMKLALRRVDLKYATRIGKEQTDTDDTRPVRVVFNEQKTRDRVYKERIKIQNRAIWISEDLTPRRGEIAYKARKAVRDKTAIKTWTFGGNIFLKTTEDGRPKKIETDDDLPRADIEEN
jgi:hypothetical protein